MENACESEEGIPVFTEKKGGKAVGTELEIKFAVDDLQKLDCMLCDTMIREKMQENNYRFLKMDTTYFDTESGALSAKKWMLRIRKENDQSFVTMKTPGEGYARGEWNVQADYLEDAVPLLVKDGAPKELTALLGDGLLPICGVQFTRILGRLAFSDGTACDLCGDIGQFTGGGKTAPLCELELELTDGQAQTMLDFARALQTKYGLAEQKKPKLVRARELIQQR